MYLKILTNRKRAGSVYCHCPVSDQRKEMAYEGFEREEQSQISLSCGGIRDRV